MIATTEVEQANGFFASNGVSGRIPEGYTHLEKRFMHAVEKAGQLWKEAPSGISRGIKLLEWNKLGWTYHAKGRFFMFWNVVPC